MKKKPEDVKKPRSPQRMKKIVSLEKKNRHWIPHAKPHTQETKDKMSVAARKPQYWTEEKFEELIEALETWVLKDDSIALEDFCIEYKVRSSFFQDIGSKSKALADTIDQVKMCIAKRMRNQLNTGVFSYGYFMRLIAMYNPFLKAHERQEKEFDAILKEQIARGAASPITNVYVTDYSNAQVDEAPDAA